MRFFLKFSIALSFILGATFIFLPHEYGISFPRNPGPILDSQNRTNHREYIETHHPQIVLMGDSTLFFGVDSEALTEQTGKSVYTINYGGMSSAMWYLIMKNNIVDSSYKPEHLVIVFRSTILTAPGFRVLGYNLKRLDEYARPKDYVFIQNSYVNLMNPAQFMSEKYFPLYVFRGKLRDNFDAYLRYTAPALAGCDKGCTDGILYEMQEHRFVNLSFIEGDANASESYLYTNRQLDFDASLKNSYLPELIEMAKENGIDLVFVRIKVMADVPQSKLDAYNNALSSYLAENNVSYIDFGADSRFTKDHFQDFLHLNEQGKALFTELLASELYKQSQKK
jgi:hypothetical protein